MVCPFRFSPGAKRSDHPGQRSPPALLAREAHQELGQVGEGAEPRIGDGKGARRRSVLWIL